MPEAMSITASSKELGGWGGIPLAPRTRKLIPTICHRSGKQNEDLADWLSTPWGPCG